MDRVRGPIEKINYGQDDKNIYLAFQGDMEVFKKSKFQLELIIEETGEAIIFNIHNNYDQDGVIVAIDERMEVELSKLHCKDYKQVHLRFEILQGKEIVQTMPGYGALAMNLEDDYTANWFV